MKFLNSNKNVFSVKYYKSILIIIFVMCSNNCYSQIWKEIKIQRNDSKTYLNSIQSLSIHDSSIFVSICDNEGMYLSTDLGAKWSTLQNIKLLLYENNDTTNFIEKHPCCISLFSFNDSIMYLYTGLVGSNKVYGQHLFLSTNKGKIWYETKTNVNLDINSILIDGNNIFASDYSNGIFLSTDKGISWENILKFDYIDNGLRYTNSTNYLIKTKDKLFVAAQLGYILSSSDYGKNWNVVFKTSRPITSSELINLGNSNISVFKSFNSYLYVVTEYGQIYISKDLGNSWINYSETYFRQNINDFIVWNNYLIAATSNGVYLNYKSSWYSIGLKGNEINSLAILKDNLIAIGQSLWEYRLSEIENNIVK